ncbi:MAG TPA: cell division protein SepF [Methanoregulaceae archaeon]|nr:cell division protein SepF [Methanoregulaceae archaeon]HQJ88948.1 cell division protein SepF [Methanoregulaceae archaeon]
MASKILDSLLGKSAVPKEDDYMELDLSTFESASPDDEPASCYVKIAGILSMKDTPKIKDEIYNGNIVIADISQLKLDKITSERVLKDLKEVARDVNGDIVGLGDQRYVVITPQSIKISREKIVGGF